MRIEAATYIPQTWTVHVDAGELIVASGKALPYPTCIGTFDNRGRINVWTPAASVPRGYKAAAKALLERCAAEKGYRR